jgi:ABC-type lipoprotein export system ATPase subunit
MFFEKIEFHRFKQFKSGKVVLKPSLSLIVGGNNAGKSSILHGLAVWEFCKTILEFTKGRKAWVEGSAGQGIGIGIAEFSPISVPSLKHLWTDLKFQKIDELDGYTLKIKAIWKTQTNATKHLEFGLSLANDRLFIKTTSSNLELFEVESEDGTAITGVVPRIAYLPPFAGITDKESRSSVSVRNRLIGQGLSGGVIRNVLYDLWLESRKKRLRLRGGKSKISNADLENLRKTDAWEILLRTLGEVFHTGLTVEEFDDRYQTYLQIETFRGKMDGPVLKKNSKDVARDLMVEGSGFLQWLSVYALALSPDVDVVLLDEPDAHLHCLLQLKLVKYLSDLAQEKNKQVLMATHSTELIKNFDHSLILEVKGSKASYLGDDGRKIAVLAGIGTNFSPKLHSLTQKKRMLIIEGDFDESMLKKWAIANGTIWPENVVVWQWSNGHKERRQLFNQLKRDIPDLKAISLRDRDDEADNTVGSDLIDKAQTLTNDGFSALKWRRRHIENYLLHPAAIARSTGKTVDEICDFFKDHHGVAVPRNVGATDVVMSMRDARGKEITTSGTSSLEVIYNVTRYQIAENMTKTELAEDVVTFLDALSKFAES